MKNDLQNLTADISRLYEDITQKAESLGQIRRPARFVVQDARARGQSLDIHAWIYGLQDGRLRDLEFSEGESTLPSRK